MRSRGGDDEAGDGEFFALALEEGAVDEGEFLAADEGGGVGGEAGAGDDLALGEGAVAEQEVVEVFEGGLGDDGEVVADDDGQAFGAAGLNNDYGLAAMYATARLLRLADGPDEVHRNQLGQLELRRHADKGPIEPHNTYVATW